MSELNLDCHHNNWILGLSYCPDCGEQDIKTVVLHRHLSRLNARNIELEQQLAALREALEVEKNSRVEWQQKFWIKTRQELFLIVIGLVK